jgi:hypothetical protein
MGQPFSARPSAIAQLVCGSYESSSIAAGLGGLMLKLTVAAAVLTFLPVSANAQNRNIGNYFY